MKNFIALVLVTLGVTVSAHAQWIVYDPANTIQSIINTTQEIAKFVEMINNQVQQIQANRACPAESSEFAVSVSIRKNCPRKSTPLIGLLTRKA